MPMTPAVDVLVGAVLFTDLVGFTEYTDSEGDAAALRVLEQQTELMTTIIAGSADARIVKELGDGLLVWFGLPLEAIESGASMLSAVAAARADGFPVAIRMGLHHGEMLPRGDDLIGTTVNVAARIAALAGPGELLASEESIDACGAHRPSARLDSVGPVTVKGLTDPIWIVRVGSNDA